MIRRCFLIACAMAPAVLSGCAASRPQAIVMPHGSVAIAVAQRGWHTEIAIPTGYLTGPIANLGPARIHARYLLIGYGARAYFTNPKADAGDAAEALFPGPSAINLTAMDSLEEGSVRRITWLTLPPQNISRMLDFVWRSMPNQGDTLPTPIVTISSTNMFYAAQPDYNALYNCNNWAVDVLRAGGLPFSNSGVHFSSDVQAQAQRIAAEQAAP